MRWDLSFRRQALGDPFSEGRRVWEWIQQIRPLHPSLDLWRPTADSPQEAEQAPPPSPRTTSFNTSTTPKPPPATQTSASPRPSPDRSTKATSHAELQQARLR